MRKKFEVVQGGKGNLPPSRKFDPGTETVIITDCRIVRETERAWLIWMPSETKDHWFPKSQCILHTHVKNKALHDVEIPSWVAKDKGLEC